MDEQPAQTPGEPFRQGGPSGLRSLWIVLAVLGAAAAGAYPYVTRYSHTPAPVAPVASVVAPVAPPNNARNWFAAPSGAPGNEGTRERPLSLAEALSQKSPVRPGDTLWLLDGTYKAPLVSHLTGTAEAPILVRQAPGARARIDSAPAPETALYIEGAWTTYWGFEVTNSSPHVSFESLPLASGPPVFDKLTRGIGIEVRAPHTKIINTVVHDLAGGFGIWSDAENAEAYGNILYYNGFIGPDRGHGHGIYVQNRGGQRLLSDNIIFNQFDHGIHAYGSSAASLDHITLEGNVVFNNGLAEGRYSGNILLGGGRLALDPVVRDNLTYFSAAVRGGGDNNLGYNAGCANLVATGNTFAGGKPLVLAGGCGGTVSGNTFYGAVSPDIMTKYPANTYVQDRPSGTQVVVRPNRFEPGRAHIVIYNWDRWRTVDVDLTPARLVPGTKFEIRDVQNFYGPPLVTGTFDGRPVPLAMRGLQMAAPNPGIDTPPHSAPEFGVFVLLPQQP